MQKKGKDMKDLDVRNSKLPGLDAFWGPSVAASASVSNVDNSDSMEKGEKGDLGSVSRKLSLAQVVCEVRRTSIVQFSQFPKRLVA